MLPKMPENAELSKTREEPNQNNERTIESQPYVNMRKLS